MFRLLRVLQLLLGFAVKKSLPVIFNVLVTICTITTVGYGDMIPNSFYGRIIGAITMFSGIQISVPHFLGLLFVAMPSLIITRNFDEDLFRQERFKAGQYSLIDIHAGLQKQD